MTLWSMLSKNDAFVDRICSSLDSTIVDRLREIGLDEGQSIKCLRRSPGNGPVVFQISDSVFTLERKVAEKIFIKKV